MLSAPVRSRLWGSLQVSSWQMRKPPNRVAHFCLDLLPGATWDSHKKYVWRKKSTMNNPWIAHVQKYASARGITYGRALSLARPSYKQMSTKSERSKQHSQRRARPTSPCSVSSAPSARRTYRSMYGTELDLRHKLEEAGAKKMIAFCPEIMPKLGKPPDACRKAGGVEFALGDLYHRGRDAYVAARTAGKTDVEATEMMKEAVHDAIPKFLEDIKEVRRRSKAAALANSHMR